MTSGSVGDFCLPPDPSTRPRAHWTAAVAHLDAVSRSTEKLLCEILLARHQAANSRPSASAAWIRLPRTSRHSCTRCSLATITSAASTRSPSALRKPHRLQGGILDLRLDHQEVQVTVLASFAPGMGTEQDHPRLWWRRLRYPTASLLYHRVIEHALTIPAPGRSPRPRSHDWPKSWPEHPPGTQNAPFSRGAS
jgi:hypothetical protein